MKIYCKELDRYFDTHEDMFAQLKANESAIITMKTENIYKSVEKGHSKLKFLDTTKVSVEDAEKAGFKVEDDYIYPIISTTKYMDSHSDVHFDGCFKRTVKEQKGNVYYILDHELKFNSIIAWQKDVEMFISDIPWSWVGKDYEGNTQALVFKIRKDAIILPNVLKAIEDKDAEFENSIRMRYIKVKFAINSNNKDYAVNKQYWDSRINEIANNKEAKEQGYFWGVEELAIYKEGSLVVAGGSNDATSIVTGNDKNANNKEVEQPEESVNKNSNYYFLKHGI